MPKDLSQLPRLSNEDQKWGVAEGDHGGAPLLVRFNQDARDWCAHPGLPVKLGFAIPLLTQHPGGMPDPEENETLGGVEEILLREIEAVTIGVQAMVLTNGVMKEYLFYIPAGVDVAALHQTVMKAVTSHEVQCMAEEEPEWDSYKAFTPA